MSILVSTTLSDAAFFAGETFSCSITFTNTSKSGGLGTRSTIQRRSISLDHNLDKMTPKQIPTRQFVIGPNSIQYSSLLPNSLNGNAGDTGNSSGVTKHDNAEVDILRYVPPFPHMGRRKKPNSRSLSIVTGGKIALTGILEETNGIVKGNNYQSVISNKSLSPNSRSRRTISMSAAGSPRSWTSENDNLVSPSIPGMASGLDSSSPKQFNMWTPFGNRSSAKGNMTNPASNSGDSLKSPTFSSSTVSALDSQMSHLSVKQNEDISHAFSVDLDTAEGTPRSSVDFYMGRNDSDESVASNIGGLDLRFGNSRRSIAIGRNSSMVHLAQQRNETILWSFAQVVGNFTVDETLVKKREFDSLKTKVMYGSAGAGGPGGAVGGGSLGFLGGGGLLRGMYGGFFGMSHTKSSLADMQHRSDAKSIPVFSTPPSILFVDLHLGPGESKTFTYQLKLPMDLPPTHKGKAAKFTYNLIIGTHRAGSAQQSKIIQLPFRVYNHVAESGHRPMYDLMNPVILYKDEAVTKEVSDAKEAPILFIPKATKESFEIFVKGLLKSKDMETLSPLSNSTNGDPTTTLSVLEERDISCKAAIEEVSRKAQKVLFDIKRNGTKISQIILLKSNYKLGEPVIGVIIFEGTNLPIYRVSITLESQEIIEKSIAYKPSLTSQKLMRKQHGWHHESTLNTSRMFFNLMIPSNASPEFKTSGISLDWSVHFEFAVSQSAVTNIPEQIMLLLNEDDRQSTYHAVPNLMADTFECRIGIRVYPNNMESSRAMTPTLNFLA